MTSTYVDLKKGGGQPQNPGFDTWLKPSNGGGVVRRAWVNDDASDPSLLFFTDKTARPGGKIDRGRCSGAEVRLG